MLLWLIENISTIVISVILIAVVVAILFSMIRSNKKGKTACGCECGACPMSGSCHQKK